MTVIAARDLDYRYPTEPVDALHEVTFEVPEASIFAVLGPNGSGKTTLFNLLLGLLPPTSGHLTVLGDAPDDRANKRYIGWVPAELSQSLMLTVDEYFSLLASTQPAFDHDLAQALLEPFDLLGAARKLTGALSHGMRKKVQLIGAMAHRPRLLVLDEPFSGLDPQSHHILEGALRSLTEAGTTVVVSSHQIEVVHYLATDLAILDGGSLRAVGRPDDLLAAHGARSLRELYLSVTGVIQDTAHRAQTLSRLIAPTSTLI
ncbi:MAG: ABC transporter ATP-binding protein [Acidimicrobiales bacterium]